MTDLEDHLKHRDEDASALLRQVRDLELKLKTKEDLIKNLQNSLELKDDQIKTLKDSSDLKSEQIKTLENSLNIKDEKIKTLEKTIDLKQGKIIGLEESMVDKILLEQKEEELNEKMQKLDLLRVELEKADQDLEALEQENESLRNQLAVASGGKIIDWTDLDIPRSLILEKMREILSRAVYNVTIAVPNIKDLQELYLYELRSSVNMKVSCYLNHGLEEDAQLLEELESLDNISIRLYEGEDRFVLDRDGEELLFAVIGNKDNNHLVLHTKDSKHLKLFRSLVMEGWLRSRKIE